MMVRMLVSNRLLLAVVAPFVCGCGESNAAVQPIFVDGRAVATQGDSIVAFAISRPPAVLVRNRTTNVIDTLGANFLSSPVHVESSNNRWYVSDFDEGNSSIVVIDADGSLERRIDLSITESTRHQFAVLPDGRIVLEGSEGNLMVLDGDSTSTFAVTEVDVAKTGLLASLAGGVIHAVPDKYITLYNAFGKIRWRVEWPWRQTAYVSDIAVDANGRPHFLAGIDRTNDFLVYSFSPVSGEVVRWSPRGQHATFKVRRLGDLEPDSAVNWLGP